MDNQTDVSLSLAMHVISTIAGLDRNLVYSPLSMYVVLCIIVAGSSEGPTRDQLLGFLKHSKSIEDLNSSLSSQLVTLLKLAEGGGPRLSFVHGVWVDRSLTMKQPFKEVLEDSYRAHFSNHVDFKTNADEARKEVNTWAEKQSNGLIEEILPSSVLDESTALVFANAMHFEGAWDEKFDASKTKDNDFFLFNGSSIQVPFMTTSSTNKKQYIRVFEDFKVLGLPYEVLPHSRSSSSSKFSMYIFLPDTKDGLPSLLEKFGTESRFVERHIPYDDDDKISVGDFRIPKFKINFGFEASELLKGLGLVLPFSSSGGLSEMVEGQKCVVSVILQKSFIEVNEIGTTAATASACEFRMTCAPFVKEKVKVDFVADHPFLFVIREDTTGLILFLGQVLNPLLG